MQIAAASPGYVTRESVPADVIEKEKSIYRAQMESSGKPANVIDKIVEGQARKLLLSRSCCRTRYRSGIRRATVKDVIAQANKTLNASITVTRFARLKVGEATT